MTDAMVRFCVPLASESPRGDTEPVPPPYCGEPDWPGIDGVEFRLAAARDGNTPDAVSLQPAQHNALTATMKARAITDLTPKTNGTAHNRAEPRSH